MAHVLHNGPFYLGAPPALEVQNLLIWSACLLLAPLALDLVPKVASMVLW